MDTANNTANNTANTTANNTVNTTANNTVIDGARPQAIESADTNFDLQVHTLIIGAGACGLVAALAAVEAGQQVLVIEADAIPSGSTALSAGLIPAAGTRLQSAAGIEDDAKRFAADIQAKAHAENSPGFVEALAAHSAEVIHWLMDEYELPFSLIDDFDYPGHSCRRMHGLPTRAGAELINALRSACEAKSIDIICQRRARVLYHQGLAVSGVGIVDPDGATESIGCHKLILACNGFGGNRTMVARHLSSICEGLWFGHDGNQGEAVQWAESMGACVKHLGAFQGHGNVAYPQGILVTWAVITQGGVQINLQGLRFWDESQGYSEAAAAVLKQPEGVAISVFDERIARVARQFEDFKQAEATGAIRVCDSIAALANEFSLPPAALHKTLLHRPAGTRDEFGRRWQGENLQAPYYAVRVTGALFHTQGGLEVNEQGRVRHSNGEYFSNLFAGGGAAVGVSGKKDSGYLSGNGLLSAVVLGYLAGRASLARC